MIEIPEGRVNVILDMYRGAMTRMGDNIMWKDRAL